MSYGARSLGALLALTLVYAAHGQTHSSPFAADWSCGTVHPTDGTHNLQLWEDGIVPYEFDPAVGSNDRAKFLAGLGDLAAVADLTFVERTDETDYVYVTFSTTPGVSFSSSVGKAGGMQTIGMWSFDSPTTIWHEMMHALGFYHEQSRIDRDQYVRIVWAEIEPGFAGNFQIASGSTANGPYDFASVMHYSPFSFSISGAKTIEVLPPHVRPWQYRIGFVTELSNGDLWTLADLYGGSPPPRNVVLTDPPRDALVGRGWTPAFAWTSDGADEYALRVDDDPDFSSPELEVTLTETIYTGGAALEPNTMYFWEVTAINDVGAVGPLYDPYFRFYTGEAPSVVYVDDDAAPGGSGASWDDAMDDLQDALEVAAFPAAGVTEIKVAQGTYMPDRGSGIRSATFALPDAVTVRGGYAGIGAADPDARDAAVYETILSADLAGDDGPDFQNMDENALHVVVAQALGGAALLEGFTLRGGNADSFEDFASNVGAGMLAVDSKHTVRDCVIEGCRSEVGTILGFGRTSTVERCIFRDNHAIFAGGAIYNEFGSDMFVRETVFDGNTSQAGGAVYVGRGAPTFDRCAFTGNTAEIAGAVHTDFQGSTTLVSCLLAGNTATNGPGGAVAVTGGASTRMVNCSASGNASSVGGGVGYVDGFSSARIENGVLWANGVTELFGSWTVRSSIVKGGWPGAGNLDDDPLFVDGAGGDLHVVPGSPAIDAGDDGYLPGGASTDLDGAERVVGESVDMGAYEDQGLSVPGDVDGDGIVGVIDLLQVLADWGACAGCPADLTGDGVVDFSDFNLVIAYWS